MPKQPDKETKHNLEILKALNDAIEKGPWEENVFFQAIRKKLIDAREKFKQEVNLTDADIELEGETQIASRIAKKKGLIEIFILLYNAHGTDIHKWQAILNALHAHVLSRPIYKNEQHAKAALRAASNKQNEAYVSVFVNEHDIVEATLERSHTDRFGNELLILREGAIFKENIHRFVHKTGSYEFENQKLVWQNPIDFL